MSILINLICAWMCWRLGSNALDEGNKFIGWVGITISAANVAAVLANIF